MRRCFYLVVMRLRGASGHDKFVIKLSVGCSSRNIKVVTVVRDSHHKKIVFQTGTMPLTRKLSMKKILLGSSLILALSTALAATDTQEATPLSNSRSQAHGEAHKSARPAVAQKKVKDGSTARGEGSGIADANAPEVKAQERAAVREAKAHKEPKLQGTPK